jgi:hypothetical protein
VGAAAPNVTTFDRRPTIAATIGSSRFSTRVVAGAKMRSFAFA